MDQGGRSEPARRNRGSRFHPRAAPNPLYILPANRKKWSGVADWDSPCGSSCDYGFKRVERCLQHCSAPDCHFCIFQPDSAFLSSLKTCYSLAPFVSVMQVCRILPLQEMLAPMGTASSMALATPSSSSSSRSLKDSLLQTTRGPRHGASTSTKPPVVTRSGPQARPCLGHPRASEVKKIGRAHV